ncbi:hypothetical protein SR39_30440 [Methylobacterium radiotolerans]|nr:hypothetical protein SR39_30440 [Methylobacterium radiotolerans]
MISWRDLAFAASLTGLKAFLSPMIDARCGLDGISYCRPLRGSDLGSAEGPPLFQMFRNALAGCVQDDRPRPLILRELCLESALQNRDVRMRCGQRGIADGLMPVE